MKETPAEPKKVTVQKERCQEMWTNCLLSRRAGAIANEGRHHGKKKNSASNSCGRESQKRI